MSERCGTVFADLDGESVHCTGPAGHQGEHRADPETMAELEMDRLRQRILELEAEKGGEWLEPQEIRPDALIIVDHHAAPDEGSWVVQFAPGKLTIKPVDDAGSFRGDGVTIERQGTRIVKIDSE